MTRLSATSSKLSVGGGVRKELNRVPHPKHIEKSYKNTKFFHVEFEGYAMGMKYPIKSIAEALSRCEVPVNVNLVSIGIADNLSISSQLIIIGLDNEPIDEYGEVIVGKYRFRVAVTQIPEQLVSGFPYTDTAFFLLSKEGLPLTP